MIKEKFEVRGDMIHFEEIEVDGRKSDGARSQQQIISITEDVLTLKDIASGGKVLRYKKIKPAAGFDEA